ncbi:hypothetical protein [Micromonospora sagamiensis]|uniref:Uncharacterized protein n=1 Tax=Micromonospora sagamiensis TaxID=47875 RepID=A0A562WGC6_9ACTN|nr:hypothetical protein [Micromonospora sagamiensis]TWJ29222.1 hypothetical protein JD81_02730 [Micromonospora sagamiensis]BCL17753.1 hypothetical protein GCM10017556_54920 [Micromonospora sagamiensis]
MPWWRSVQRDDILTHTDEEIRRNVETNFLGPLFLARAFTPILSAKGGNTAIKAGLSAPLEAVYPQLATTK